MRIATDRRAEAAIVVGRDASWLERHAADELRKYIALISGARLEVTTEAPDGVSILAVGSWESNRIMSVAVKKGLTKLSGTHPGEDGFVIESLELGGANVVILGGSNDRGTLYAVYALLEDVLGVGFFRDGEHVPQQRVLDLPDLHIAERPRFPDREDGSGCIFAYSTPYWTMEDWTRELDWRAKRRANTIWPFNVGSGIVQTIMHEWGVTREPPPQRSEKTIHERALEYAKKLGMKVPIILPNGSLPETFYKAHPECRTLLTQYSEYAPTRQLHPSDPFFKQLIIDYLRHYEELYGTDHLYIAEFVSESRILEGADDARAVRKDFARSVSEAISEADPEGVWLPSSWSWDLFHDPPEGWTSDEVEEYLDAITVPVVVWDIWSEEAAKYEQTEFFFGRPWGFGVLHCFGGNTYMHGDVAGLIERVKKLDSGAGRCELFLSTPEIIGYNEFYLELAAKLSWQPSKINLNDYVADYCRHRYGAELGGAMEPAWWELVGTVYGPGSGSIVVLMDPLYWLRPSVSLIHGAPKVREEAARLWTRRGQFIPRLRRAMEIFLQNPKILETSVMAKRDLVDIARQWIAERFNERIRDARDSFLKGDVEQFHESARACLRILDEQTRLLASWPPCRLETEVEAAKTHHGEDAARARKHFHVWVTFNEDRQSEPLRDYFRMDLDELVAHYYRPRVEAFLNLLGSKMAQGVTEVTDDELDPIYSAIERDFIASPLHQMPRGEDPVDVIRELLHTEDEGV